MYEGMAWYRKYRPVTMEQYKGQESKDIVQSRFTQKEKRPQTLMLYGERGCGKTSFERIISKYYLCQNPKPDGTPCEECETCKEINSYLIDSTDGIDCEGILEVNATTANKKDDVERIMQEAVVPPLYTDYKIIAFDECHKITKDAQNSLLKIIEDIPKHLVVMFLTTDPQDVIAPLQSRCQVKLEVKRQTADSMIDRLMEISQAENLTVTRQALELVVKKGDRIPRECINLLESVALANDYEVTLKTVQKTLGNVSADLYMDFFEAANSSLEDILQYVNELKSNGTEFPRFMKNMARFVVDIMYVKHGISLNDFSPEFVKRVKSLFNTYTSQDFDMLLQIIEKTSFEIANTDSSTQEMLLILMGMRVSKIQLLAEGLANEYDKAAEENKISLAEHSKYAQAGKNQFTEDEQVDIDLRDVKDFFGGIQKPRISDEMEKALRNLDLPVEESKSVEEKKEGNSVDSILDDIF